MELKTVYALFFLFMTCLVFGQGEPNSTVKRSIKLMGSAADITVISGNEDLGYIYIQEAIGEVQRIEKLIASWDKDSETSKINANAGVRPVAVSWELFKLIERCVQISEITNGAFDISYTALTDVWKFDGSMTSLPSTEELKGALAKVGYSEIILNSKDQTVYLAKKGMRLSFSAIGKGYAADRAKAFLVSKGVNAGIINLGGDITTWGTRTSGQKWLIGIVNPEKRGSLFSWLPLLESSVATSGGGWRIYHCKR